MSVSLLSRSVRRFQYINQVYDPVFFVLTLLSSCTGYIANCAVVGCLAFWAPKAGAEAFKMENADLVFGGVTVATGLLGTFVGGVALDFLGSTMSNAFLVSAFGL